MKKLIMAAWLASGLAAFATIDTGLQMQLGNPSGATADTNNHSHYLSLRPVFAMDFNDDLGVPNWVSWNLTAPDSGTVSRSANFYYDSNLPPNFTWVGPNDYSGSGYDRGHMCPSADRTDVVSNNLAVFVMSNIIPQTSQNNSGVWAQFESYCRTLSESSNEVLIICGPSGFNGSRISSGMAAISSNVWKTVVVVTNGPGTALSRLTLSNRVITLRVPNTTTVTTPWQQYITSARTIELETGFNFFSALPGPIASAYRARIDGLTNAAAPAIASFAPFSGTVGSTVVITGTNFTSASVVSFNGTSASYYVDSSTQITATVPAGATTGVLSVTTPGGTAVSATSFTVGTVFLPDLAVSCTHTSPFTQGDTGRTFNIVVSNVGNSNSSGTVTLTNFLPAGLALTDLSGTGWSVDTNTLTASRADSLAATSSYPALTLTVSVASNAPPVVTNRVVVAGGNETSTGNNSSSDIVTINSLAGPAITLAAWDMSGQTVYGVSPLAATTSAANVTVGGLTRGAGVTTGGTGLTAGGWGGATWTNASAAGAVGTSNFATFAVSANFGYDVSFSTVSKFDYRRSSTGPSNGTLQYRLGTNAFVDIASFSYPSNTSAGGSISPIDLSSVTALQHVPNSSNVTFRIVNWSGTNPNGTWYLFDVAGSTAADFTVLGTVAVVGPPAILAGPTDRTNNIGGSTTFTLSSAAAGAVLYQWRFNSVALAGATNASLTLTNLQPTNGGFYSVVLNNGGGAVTSSPALLSLNYVPVAGADVFYRAVNESLVIPIATLLTNDTDFENDPIAFDGLSETSTNLALMDQDGVFVYYTPPLVNPNVPDQFSYTITDVRGGLATGTVTVNVIPRLTLSGQAVAGNYLINAPEGVAGVTYYLQSATNLAPAVWQTIGTNTLPTNGPVQFTDPLNGATRARFYRVVLP